MPVARVKNRRRFIDLSAPSRGYGTQAQLKPRR